MDKYAEEISYSQARKINKETDIKNILLRNDEQFLKDIKRVRGCLCYCGSTRRTFSVTKKSVMEEAKYAEIKYGILEGRNNTLYMSIS